MEALLDELETELAIIQQRIDRLRKASADSVDTQWQTLATLATGEAYSQLRAARTALGRV